MKDVIYVTGNPNKAKYFMELIGLDIEHAPADVDEIQSLDQIEVVTAKAKEAYRVLKRPVLIEDTALTIDCMGKLPGTFIKWFLEELNYVGVCRLADQDNKRLATASCTYAHYDGKTTTLFSGELAGSIAQNPRNVNGSGFGWNAIFIPAGQELTLSEMDDESFKIEYVKIKPIKEVRAFLQAQ